MLVALGGGRLVYPLRWRAGGPEPGPLPAGTVHHLTCPDGTILHLESYGLPDAPSLLCTGSVSKVEMAAPMGLIYKVLFPSISTLETPP